MNKTFRVRLGILLGAVVLITVLLALGAQRLWIQITDLEVQLNVTHLEAFHLAGDFEQRMLRLNNLVLRFIARHQSETWSQFERLSQEINQWVNAQLPLLTSARERQLLTRMKEVLDEYLAAASVVRGSGLRPTTGELVLPELSGLEQREQQLLELSLELGEAHRVAKASFVDHAHHSLIHLRRVLVGGVAFLTVLLGAIGWVSYRDLVAPLRTRLVRSEEMLRHHEKLATLGTLAAGIAHEIRNPLTSIKARLYTLGKHLPPEAPALRDAGVIGLEIQRLEGIVQEVLQFARPAEPQLVPTPAQVPLREVADFMASTIARAGMHVEVAGGPEATIRIDPDQLKQVLINLAQNALEAMQPGGRLTLRVREEMAFLHGQPRRVAILEVTDTGTGLSPEVQKRLFDPFFTTKETGTGLGLSIAARIVEKHGGVLRFRTQEGHGTTFEIVLPQHPANAGGNASRDSAVG